ncbi:protein PHLOEM PROTEIN 2-LIKE A9 [Elaeis guineensis]|uniref:Protein PHLOEM PROTEIN 2-LIKE A9 n=1 Tax=Elaeis guineensis var. tenera TaxID=51953 RepID=A0A6I9SCU1_ELAGV|nr:protein PHLOEM PROTEIN 2-LIKE A9 [Elaeis guineensis]
MSHYKGSERVLEEPAYSTKVGDTVTIKPQALDIIWGKDNRYWRVTQDEAELLQVCWLEVTGSYPFNRLTKGATYKVTFNVKTKPDAFGWSDSPVYLMVKVDGKYTWKKADLSQLKNNMETNIPAGTTLTFTVPANAKDQDNLTFGLYEIWRGRWKGGLVIKHVTIERSN